MDAARASTADKRFSFDMQKRSTAAVRLTMMNEGIARRATAQQSIIQARTPPSCGNIEPSFFSFNRYAKSERFYIRRPFNDFADCSRNPSFTKFMSDYARICDLRYRADCTKYERQFQKELKILVTNQASASEAVNFLKHISINTIWPPLHTRKELKKTSTFFEIESPKEKQRLLYLLANKII